MSPEKPHIRVPGKPSFSDAPELWASAILPDPHPTPPPSPPAPQSDQETYNQVETRTLRSQLDHWPTAHDLCGKGCITGWSPDGLTRAVWPMHCGRWDCKPCADFKRRVWTAKIISGHPERWFTLTMQNDDDHPLAHQAQVAIAAWPKLVRLIRKKYGKFEYARCTQVGKNGGFHFHVPYTGEYIPQQWLSQAWRSLTGSYIVEISWMASNAKIASYVARYVARDAAVTNDSLPKHRLITMSRHYLPPKKRHPASDRWEGWTFAYTIQAMDEVLAEWSSRLTERCWANADGSCWLFEIKAPPECPPRRTPRPPPEPTLFLPTAGR